MIFKVLVIDVENGTIAKCDGIEHEGKLWLVPHWLEVPAQGVTKPARIIRFDSIPHQRTPNSRQGVEYVINYPIPKELFGSQTPRQAIPGFEFQELPEITLPLKDRTLNWSLILASS
jgi:hypothetical protein